MLKTALISLLFLQAINTFALTDTLVAVKKSRLAYCVTKIEENTILNERILSKDSAIQLAESRLTKKDEEIASYKTDNQVFNEQLGIKNSENRLVTEENLHLKSEIKKLKKKNTVKTIGLILLIALSGYAIAT